MGRAFDSGYNKKDERPDAVEYFRICSTQQKSWLEEPEKMEAGCGNCDGILVARESGDRTNPYCARCHSWWTDKTLKLVRKHRRRPPENTQVSLVYEPNGTSHNDIILRVGTWADRSDSYYHELDHRADRPPDTMASIRAMLLQWRASVVSAPKGISFYLPHDFSDQSSGWLRGSICGDHVELVAGWSSREGWAFYPSDYLEQARDLDDFQAIDDLDPFSMLRSHLVADIDRSLSELEEGSR